MPYVNPAIPNLLSKSVLANLDHAHVWTEGYNTNYEGQIKGKGDSLRILSYDRPEVSDYQVGPGNLTGPEIEYQRIRPTPQYLVIDQDKHWAIAEDGLERMLSSVNGFRELRNNATWSLVDQSDRFLALKLAAEAGVVNPLGQTITAGYGSGESSPYVVLERIANELRLSAVKKEGLHIFVPTWFMTMLRVDPRFSSFGTSQNRSTARGESIVEMAGITIHETLNALDDSGEDFSAVDGGSGNTIVANWQGAATWGRHIPPEGMVQAINASQNVYSFDHVLRARYVFGATVTIPKAVVTQVVEEGDFE